VPVQVPMEGDFRPDCGGIARRRPLKVRPGAKGVSYFWPCGGLSAPALRSLGGTGFGPVVRPDMGKMAVSLAVRPQRARRQISAAVRRREQLPFLSSRQSARSVRPNSCREDFQPAQPTLTQKVGYISAETAVRYSVRRLCNLRELMLLTAQF
jgi:hypothetical protein